MIEEIALNLGKLSKEKRKIRKRDRLLLRVYNKELSGIFIKSKFGSFRLVRI